MKAFEINEMRYLQYEPALQRAFRTRNLEKEPKGSSRTDGGLTQSTRLFLIRAGPARNALQSRNEAPYMKFA
jgi:hypothetical protein